MNQKKRIWVSVVAGVLALVMILGLVFSILPVRAAAKSSSDLKGDLAALEKRAAAIKEEQRQLEKEQAANTAETRDTVDRKRDVDQQIKLLAEEIDNTNAQIQSYNLLISTKQKELDEAQTRQEDLNEKYLLRLRTMEESGEVQYWSVIFKAKSFSDLLDRINMISEIAAADQAMMEQLEAVSKEIAAAQAELAEEKGKLQEQKDAFAEAQTALDAKRVEEDALLRELAEDKEALAAMAEKYDADAAAVSDQIAQKEKEYTEALKKEEEERRQQEAANSGNSGNSGSSGGSGNSGGSAPSSSGWARPVSSLIVTCPYGYRTHPVTGQLNNFHNGVDLGMPQGSPIYATRSGTVTTAHYSNSWGYQVVINHGDGFSSMYAHMTHYIVSVGQHVEQGQVIGYVGSTGWSTGPHLHFTIYYNGGTVNPMGYIR